MYIVGIYHWSCLKLFIRFNKNKFSQQMRKQILLKGNIKRSVYCQYGQYSLTFRALALRQREGPMLETLDYTIRIGTTSPISMQFTSVFTFFFSNNGSKSLTSALCFYFRHMKIVHCLGLIMLNESLYNCSNANNCVCFSSKVIISCTRFEECFNKHSRNIIFSLIRFKRQFSRKHYNK